MPKRKQQKPLNIFRVLVDPRGFMKEVLPRRRISVWYLAAIVGFSWLLGQALGFELGYRMPLWLILVISVVCSVPVGYALFFITAFFLYWGGKIVKGKGDFWAVYRAFAFSKTPEFFISALWIVMIVLLGRATFTNILMASAYPSIITILLLVQIVFLAWQFVILLHTLGEVQGFSAWMSIWNVFFAWIALMLIYEGVIFLLAFFISPDAFVQNRDFSTVIQKNGVLVEGLGNFLK